MPLSTILEFAALAVILITGACVVYAMSEMRRTYTEQQEQVVRTMSLVEGFRKIQQEFDLFLGRIESDGHALQNIALQIETAVAALKDGIGASMSSSTERQTAAVENLRDHLDIQEERLATILQSIANGVQSPQSPKEPQNGNNDHSRLRREALNQDPKLRFSVLTEWVSINALAILHRASRGWTSSNDLIANIPVYLEPDAEVLENSVLLVGTRGHCEKLAIPLGKLDQSANFSNWFDPALNGHTTFFPAVLGRSGSQWIVVSKGTNV